MSGAELHISVDFRRRGEGGGPGVTSAITRLETLVMRAVYHIKCFFSLILSFGYREKFLFNFPGLFKVIIITSIFTRDESIPNTRNINVPIKYH